MILIKQYLDKKLVLKKSLNDFEFSSSNICLDTIIHGDNSSVNIIVTDRQFKMSHIKQLILLILFTIATVNLTFMILDTNGELSVNSTLLKHTNTALKVLGNNFNVLHKNFTANFNKFYQVPKFMESFLHKFQISLSNAHNFFMVKPYRVFYYLAIFLQTSLFLWDHSARLRNFLACAVWIVALYGKETIDNEQNLLIQVSCSVSLIVLLLQMIITSKEDVKIFNLNISNSKRENSLNNLKFHRINKTDIKNKTNEKRNNKDLYKTDNSEHSPVMKQHENIFLSDSLPKSFNFCNNENKNNLILSQNNLTLSQNKLPLINKLNSNSDIDKFCNSLSSIRLTSNPFNRTKKQNPHFTIKKYNPSPNTINIFSTKLNNTNTQKQQYPQQIAQQSWVAGGYWKKFQDPTILKRNSIFSTEPLTPLSRSSSQSSGFSSQSSSADFSCFRMSLVDSHFLSQFDDRLSVQSEPPYHCKDRGKD